MGIELGALARQRFPGGILVDTSRRRISEALARTAELLADPAVPAIFEGAFEFEGVVVRADILVRMSSGEEGGRWQLIEVKSSIKTRDMHLDDVAIQYYVIRGAGLSVGSAGLMTVNACYVCDGGMPDVERLFMLRDVTDEIGERLIGVPSRLMAMRETLKRPMAPEREPGAHCHTPHECPFWNYCTKDKPARWVYYLPGGGDLAARLHERGIHTIDDIPEDVPLSLVQRRMKANIEWLSADLAQRLNDIHYPVHHLDFETFMPAVPKFPSTRPFQVLPMQWSNHIEYADGTVVHHEFLCRRPEDPRAAFMTSLLSSLGEEGSICVYSNYEGSILQKLAETFPDFRRQIEAVIARLWDLYQVIKDHYYHPHFGGSYSIKAVLPALVSAIGYHTLPIQDGSSAARAYYRMIFEESDWVEQDRIAESLLRYCATDTQAMLEIRRVLKRRAASLS
jgi:hypothetical protein